jgi:outer membrane protein, adhesin transport system
VAKERRIAYEGTLQQALDRYQQVFGHAPDVSSDFAKSPLPPVDLIPGTLDEAVKAAQDENPAVDVAKKNVGVSSERTRIAESGYYPTLDLVGHADYASYTNATDGMRRDWSILLQMNWSLFSGFRTQAQVAQASYDYGASKDNASQAGRKAAEAVRLAWTQLATAKERLKLLDNAVNLAHEVYEARKKMREAGKETLINVLDAESAITNADITYAMADYDLRTAAYQLVHDVGRLEVADLDRRSQTGSPSGNASSPKAQ